MRKHDSVTASQSVHRPREGWVDASWVDDFDLTIGMDGFRCLEIYPSNLFPFMSEPRAASQCHVELVLWRGSETEKVNTPERLGVGSACIFFFKFILVHFLPRLGFTHSLFP